MLRKRKPKNSIKLTGEQMFDLILKTVKKMEKRPRIDLRVFLWNKKIKKWIPYWLTKDNKLKNDKDKIIYSIKVPD